MQSSAAPSSTNSVTTLADGRYRLMQVLGTGGMATVYRAYDSRLDVERAIKVLHPSMSRKKSIRVRFDNEARTMAKLHHPNIVMVHDVAAEGDIAYMVMEMLEGGSVMGWIERYGPMPPRLAVDVTLAMLSALELSHARGIVHRDIKPHNVLLAVDGVPKLTDFGIAQLREGQQSMTATSAVMGTWAYMAPEQKQSAKSVDGRSDLYAVACSLYAMITGEEPFDLFSTEVHEDVKVRLPVALAEIVRKGARYRADDRYADAGSFADALKKAYPELPEIPADAPPLGGNTIPAPSGGPTSLTFDTDSLPGTPVPVVSIAVDGTMEKAPAVSPSGFTTGTSENSGVTKGQVAAAAAASVTAIGALIAVAVLIVVVVAVALTWNGAPAAADPPPVVVAAEPPAEPPPVEVPVAEPVEAAVEVAPVEPPPVDPPPAEAAVVKASSPKPKVTTPKATPSPAATTKLYVNSRPWSYISIDGEKVGRTGWSGDLPSGRHEVVLETSDGAVARTTVSVSGAEKRFCWDFAASAECAK